MEALGWFSFLIVGLIAGWIAEKVMKRDHGIIRNLVVGVIGAYLGAFLFSIVGFEAGGFLAALIVASIGAILLLWIVAKVMPSDRRS
jgi:uncharacterized membrane protein YeaQ/YmgE (transglycosylase-associated protein family)